MIEFTTLELYKIKPMYSDPSIPLQEQTKHHLRWIYLAMDTTINLRIAKNAFSRETVYLHQLKWAKDLLSLHPKTMKYLCKSIANITTGWPGINDLEMDEENHRCYCFIYMSSIYLLILAQMLNNINDNNFYKSYIQIPQDVKDLDLRKLASLYVCVAHKTMSLTVLELFYKHRPDLDPASIKFGYKSIDNKIQLCDYAGTYPSTQFVQFDWFFKIK